jgi:hypothetical protein
MPVFQSARGQRPDESGAHPRKPFMNCMNGFHKEAQLAHPQQTANFALWRCARHNGVDHRITTRNNPVCARLSPGSARSVQLLLQRKRRANQACDGNAMFVRFATTMPFSQELDHVRQFRFGYINARLSQLNQLTKEWGDKAINYVMLTNAGGAVAVLSFMGGSGKVREMAGPIIALGCFSLGVIVTGILIAKQLHRFEGFYKGYKKDSEQYLADQIEEWNTVVEQDEKRIQASFGTTVGATSPSFCSSVVAWPARSACFVAAREVTAETSERVTYRNHISLTGFRTALVQVRLPSDNVISRRHLHPIQAVKPFHEGYSEFPAKSGKLIEDNAFHLSKVDRLLLKMPVRLGPMAKSSAEGARLIIANCGIFDTKENSAERPARPG